jgi:hypothetical protein
MGSIVDVLDDTIFGPLNLIDRIEGMIRLAVRGDSGVRFGILRMDKGGKHSRPDVRKMLKRYGVDTFGIQHDAKHLYFLVGRRQAKWTAYLLDSAGIEYSGGVANTTPVRAGVKPTPWADKRRGRR